MEPETEQTEQRILDAAARVFGEKPFHKASVQEIADLAGVGKGTVYRRYPDKHALLLAAARSMMTRLARRSIDAIDMDRPRESIEGVTETYFRFCREHPHFPELVVRVRAEVAENPASASFLYVSDIEEALVHLVREAQQKGLVRDYEPDDIIYILRSLLFGLVFFRSFPGPRAGLEALTHTVIQLVSHGILRDR